MSNNGEQYHYENIKELGKDAANLMFELLRDRVLRLNLVRSLEINTFLLNYFLIQNYFFAFDLQEEKGMGKLLPEDKSLEASSFREYTERLHGIFILVPMTYQGQKFYSKSETDRFLNRMDAHGEFTNFFFESYENWSPMKMKEIEELLEGYVLYRNLFPYIDYDPAFQGIIDSIAVKQLFSITRTPEYLKEHNIKRYNYPVDEELKNEYEDAMKRWDEKLFQFDPKLVNFNNFLSYGANFFVVKDFGSKELMKEVIDLFRDYFMLRIPSRKEEIRKYMDLFEILFELSEGKLFAKFTWHTLKTRLRALHDEEIVSEYLDKFCLDKAYHIFPNNKKDFDPPKFVSEYNDFLIYSCYCYTGQVYTGAPLIWRSMIKYFEELQSSQEFKDVKGVLLENWCLKLIEDYGFQVEKLILKNRDIKPTEKYWNMKEQIKSFNKEALEFEVEFIDHQKKYPFHEFDIIFRAEKLLYIVECKCTAIRLSETTRYVSWGNRFENVFDVHYKKIENLSHTIKNGKITHPLFNGIVEYIPIIIQTEGLIHGIYGFDTYKFQLALANIKKSVEDGTLMKEFEDLD